MISSCIALFYLGVSITLVLDATLSSHAARAGLKTRPYEEGLRTGAYDAAQPSPASAPTPDELYRNREQLASAKHAEANWATRLSSNPHDFESAWKLARARYWLGTNGLPEAERRAALEAGIAAGRAAVAAAPDKPEGHFWIAANMGALAEAFGLRQGLKYRGDIRDELQATLKLDPKFLDGSADRALGRWYHKVPRMFGGSKQKSEEHLRKALAYNPESIITRLFLAETLVALDRKADARKELEAAIAAPLDPEWLPEDRRFKEQAKALLQKLSR